MTKEESHFYSLLLLRLSRTKQFIKSTPTEIRGNKRDVFNSLLENNLLNKNFISFTSTIRPAQQIILKDSTTMITGEASNNINSMELPYSKNNLTKSIFVQASQPKTLFINDPIKKTMHKNFSNQINNRQYGVKKDFNKLRLPFNTAASIQTGRHLATPSRDHISQEATFKLIKSHRVWPISLTNTTHEMIPAPYWPIGEHALHLNGQINHNNEAENSQFNKLIRRKLLNSAEFRVKNELGIKRMSEERPLNKHKQTSYGGSFGIRPSHFKELINQNNYVPTSSFMKAPSFKIIPTSMVTLTQENIPTISTRPYNKELTKNQYILEKWEPNSINNKSPYKQEQQEKKSTLNKLLECCQNTAPGCKNLCSKDVTKDEVKYTQ